MRTGSLPLFPPVQRRHVGGGSGRLLQRDLNRNARCAVYRDRKRGHSGRGALGNLGRKVRHACKGNGRPTTPEIQIWPIDRLVFYASNPRKNDAVVDRMCSSIREFGFKIPVLARNDGEVVDGHLRLRPLRPRDRAPRASERNRGWQRAGRCDTARTLARRRELHVQLARQCPHPRSRIRDRVRSVQAPSCVHLI